MANTSSDKILARLKGLRAQMRAGELPLFSIPAIWENATDHQSNACDLVLTNQRIFGYIYTTFPRERLFLDALELNTITAVSIRKKSFEAMFRELLVSDHTKRIYIRATSKKIEDTHTALRSAIAESVPAEQTIPGVNSSSTLLDQPHSLSNERADNTNAHASQAHTLEALANQPDTQYQVKHSPIYTRQRLNQPLERSPLGMTILLVCGLLLEVIGAFAWAITGSSQTGLPLCATGLLAVIVAILLRRQRH